MGLFGILLGLGLLVWLAYRGWTILLLAPGAALVAAAFELIGDIKQAHDLAGVAAREIRCTSSLINTNDAEGHAAVLALFDKALGG